MKHFKKLTFLLFLITTLGCGGEFERITGIKITVNKPVPYQPTIGILCESNNLIGSWIPETTQVNNLIAMFNGQSVKFHIINPLTESVPSILNMIKGLVIIGKRNAPIDQSQAPYLTYNDSTLYQFARQMMDQTVNGSRIPILGIDYGYQFLNVYYGGTLRYGSTGHQSLNVVSGTKLDQKFYNSKSFVAFLHSPQTINSLAGSLRSNVFSASDGSIQGIENISDSQWIRGVHWHPEEYNNSQHTLNLRNDFVLQLLR